MNCGGHGPDNDRRGSATRMPLTGPQKGLPSEGGLPERDGPALAELQLRSHSQEAAADACDGGGPFFISAAD
jgi:hypothetical protein